jgi:hypothetical protein
VDWVEAGVGLEVATEVASEEEEADWVQAGVDLEG